MPAFINVPLIPGRNAVTHGRFCRFTQVKDGQPAVLVEVDPSFDKTIDVLLIPEGSEIHRACSENLTDWQIDLAGSVYWGGTNWLVIFEFGDVPATNFKVLWNDDLEKFYQEQSAKTQSSGIHYDLMQKLISLVAEKGEVVSA